MTMNTMILTNMDTMKTTLNWKTYKDLTLILLKIVILDHARLRIITEIFDKTDTILAVHIYIYIT